MSAVVFTMAKRVRTPQEKKRLSLQRDRRNLYMENSKGSRKAIPLRKAIKRRAVRRISNATMFAGEELEARGASQVRRATVCWRKYEDQPLGVKIESQQRWRQRLAQRRAQSNRK